MTMSILQDDNNNEMKKHTSLDSGVMYICRSIIYEIQIILCTGPKEKQ